MPFDDDIIEELQQTYITKSRADVKVVRLGWYSLEDNDDTYHICVNCGQYGGILLPNLEISTVHKLRAQGFKLCRYCRNCLRPGRECQGMFLTVRDI